MPAKKTTTKKPAAAAAQPAPAAETTTSAPAAADTSTVNRKSKTVNVPAEPAAPVDTAAADTDDELLTALENELGIAGDDHLDDDDTADDQPDADDASDDETDPELSSDSADTTETSSADETEVTADEDGGEPAAPESPAEAKLAALEKQLAALTAKLEGTASPQAEPQQPAPGATRVFSSAEEEIASAETDADLARLQAKFQRLEDWATEHADGTEITDPNGGEPRTYTPEQIRSIGLNAKRALRALPQQAAHLQSRAKFDEIADKAYPDFAKRDSTLSRYYNTLRQDPALRRLSYLKLIIGDAERGRLGREADEKAAAGDGRPGVKVAPVARKPAPVLPAGGARKPAPATSKEARKAAANKRANAMTTGSADELAGVVESLLD